MQCFNHHDHAAVATCKACHKGVCPDCARENEAGISCDNDACANGAEQTATVMRMSAQAIARRSSWRSPSVLGGMLAGICITAMGGFLMIGGDKAGGPLIALMGIGLIGMAMSMKFRRSR
ncbi:hypothetical protein [Kordiimonas marina]|uniref:hypothetical protein n=1 Tax=Kordiimonas marina TaxID=2872312 RepID=UPI001FF26124|nr:hypothetical protein [Kordiimonas marina]MCJ9428509.1 hypothetical protein [Kordiimonas marina]